MNFPQNIGITFFTRLFTLAISLISSVIIARLLGPAGKGILSLVILVPSFIALIASLGIEISNVYYVAQKKYSLQDIIGNSVFTTVSIGIPVGFLLWFLAPFISSFFLKGTNPLFLKIAVIMIPLTLLSAYWKGILRGEQRFKNYNLTSLCGSGFLMLFIVLLVLILRLGVIGAIIGNLLSVLGAAAISWVFVRERKDYRFLPILHKEMFFDSIKFGMKGRLANILQFFNYRFDIFIVNWFLGVENVGYYVLAASISGLIWYIPDSIGTVLYPKTASSTLEEANLFTPRVCRNSIFLISLAACGLFAFSGVLISAVFGKVFLPSVKPLQILLPGIVMLSLWKVLAADLIGRGMPEYYSYAAGISLISTVFLDFILIPKMGIIGAALASTISYSLAGLLTLFWFLKKTGVNLREVILPTRGDLFTYKNAFQRISAQLLHKSVLNNKKKR